MQEGDRRAANVGGHIVATVGDCDERAKVRTTREDVYVRGEKIMKLAGQTLQFIAPLA